MTGPSPFFLSFFLKKNKKFFNARKMVIIIIIKYIYFSSLRIVSFFQPDTATALFPLRQESDWLLMGSSAECQLFLHQPPFFKKKKAQKSIPCFFFVGFIASTKFFYLLPPPWCRKEQRPVNSRIMAAVVTGPQSRTPVVGSCVEQV